MARAAKSTCFRFLQNLILNEAHSAQFSIDFRTGRRTAIHADNSCAEQRSACVALNRIRTRGILEVTQLASSGEPLSPHAWFAAVAGLSRDRDVPLIPLDQLGIHHDEDGLRSSSLLTAHRNVLEFLLEFVIKKIIFTS